MGYWYFDKNILVINELSYTTNLFFPIGYAASHIKPAWLMLIPLPAPDR